jgi:hypothetical protein
MEAVSRLARDAMNPMASPPSDGPVTPNDVLGLLALLRPWHMVNDAKVRVGSDADGGYVVPSIARASSIVVSIGIGNEISFDRELADRGAHILQFDHTIPGPPLAHPAMQYFKIGWAPHDAEGFWSLHTMMSQVDWTRARHPVLKFDTEGAEWESIDHTSIDDLDVFSVMVGEFHDLDRLAERAFFEKARAVFAKLADRHVCVHVHGNNYGGFTTVLGIPLPKVIELTYVHRGRVVIGGPSSEPLPGPLDRPNAPWLPDLCLRPF